jgi:hypothetical protein
MPARSSQTALRPVALCGPPTGTSGRSPPWWRSSNGDGAVQLTDRLGNRHVLFTGRLARSGIARFGPYVAKPVMWRWPEQPPIPSNGAPAERHISFRVPGRGGIPRTVLPLPTAMLRAWPSTQRLARELTVICRSTAFFTLVAARDTCSGYGRSA